MRTTFYPTLPDGLRAEVQVLSIPRLSVSRQGPMDQIVDPSTRVKPGLHEFTLCTSTSRFSFQDSPHRRRREQSELQVLQREDRVVWNRHTEGQGLVGTDGDSNCLVVRHGDGTTKVSSLCRPQSGKVSVSRLRVLVSPDTGTTPHHW